MALSQESKDLLADIDADSSATADRIDRLLANSNTTEAEFREALAPISARLKALAHDPNQPIPPVE